MKYFTRISICVIHRSSVGTLPSAKYKHEHYSASYNLLACKLNQIPFTMQHKLSKIGKLKDAFTYIR